jgi:hypothetical protein
MGGTKPYGPRFTILDKAKLLDNKKARPVDRSDRAFIDNGNLEVIWSISSLRKGFIKKTEDIRKILGIEVLDPKDDILITKLGYKDSIFVPKSLYIGVNSLFLSNEPKIAESLRKLIYSNILMSYNWSYNFYPFAEYYILYGKKPSQAIQPNPKQFQLIMKYHKELGRNTYTKSDIAFLKQQAVIERIDRPKRLREIETIALAVDKLPKLKNTDRRSKNLNLKTIAFKAFEKIPTGTELNQVRQLIKKNLYEIVEEYQDDADLTPKQESEFLSNMQKLYNEYLKLVPKD